MDTGILITLISLVSVALFLIGTPIFLIIGLWTIGASIGIDFTLANVGVTMFEGLNSFSLLALPLFILTGDLIAASGIANRLVDFAYSVVGWIRGGLGLSTIAACGLFAAISGSNAATTATIGSIMHKRLVDDGFQDTFSAATAASGGTVGIIIPPSIVFIVYGFLLNIPVSDLFIAGIIPGSLMVISMAMVCWWICHRHRTGSISKFRIRNVARSARRAYLGFFAIFIVLYGIYSGTFSPTEAAAIAVAFCAISGLFITKELSWKKLPNVLNRSGQLTGMLAPMVAISIVMQQIFALLGVDGFVRDVLEIFGSNSYVVLLGCMLIIFLAGCILESLPVTVIFAPILAPVAISLGINPIQFAVIFLVGSSIGFITPPFGLNLFVASGITGIPYSKIVPAIIPYLVGLLVVWLLVAFIPTISLSLIPG